MNSGIYQIRNLVNGKVYVGSAIDFKVRWKAHKNSLRKRKHHSSHLQRAWDEYGEVAFVFEVLEFVDGPSELVTREQYWLDLIRPREKERGYNIAPNAGSMLGHKWTNHSRIKQSERLMGRTPGTPAKLYEWRGRLWTVRELAKEYGIKGPTIKKRLALGYTVEEAVFTPLHGKSGLKPMGERALTPAERARQYHAKMKDNPAYKKKNAARAKAWYEKKKALAKE